MCIFIEGFEMYFELIVMDIVFVVLDCKCELCSSVMCKNVWWLFLLLMLVFIFNYIDCISVGFVVLMMNKDFGFLFM